MKLFVFENLKSLKNQKGFTVIMALLLMLGSFVIGAGLIGLTANSNQSSVHQMQSNQSFYIGHAGIENAKYNLNKGVDPTVTNQPFGGGSYSISTNPTQGLITVTSTIGAAKKTQAITANFAKHCVALNPSFASINAGNPKEMLGMQLAKTCNQRETITSLTVDWNWDPCVLSAYYSSSNSLLSCPKTTNGASVTRIDLNNTTLYNPALGIGSPSGGGSPANGLIDTVDLNLNTNTTSTFDRIQFSQNIPNGALMILTVNFADGSQITSTFQLKNAPSFTVQGGTVIVNANHTGTLRALCSQMTYGTGGASIPIKARLKTNNLWNNLWGYNPINGGEVYNFGTGPGASVIYTTEAYAQYGAFQSTYNSTNSKQVMTLLNSDTPPPLDGFGGTQTVSACLAPYLDANTGKVKLNGNQVLQLFELGIDMSYNQNSPSADYQDLILLWDVN